MQPSDPTAARVVLVTAPDRGTAEALARDVVERRLVACANLLPGVTSVFRWEGRVDTEEEVLLVLKTTAERLGALETRLHEQHPYDVPEFVALPAAHVSGPYLGWLRAAVADEAPTDPGADPSDG
ncbi:MAG: divalent-cation tolerance protein CutA [Planctomycetota bacterium]